MGGISAGSEGGGFHPCDFNSLACSSQSPFCPFSMAQTLSSLVERES